MQIDKLDLEGGPDAGEEVELKEKAAEIEAKNNEFNDQLNKALEAIPEDFPLAPVGTVSILDRMMVRENREADRRGHLGMSQIGKTDERTLWLAFRWCLPNEFEGRTLRIFDLGHVLEDAIIGYLRRCKVKDARSLGIEPGSEKGQDEPLFEILDIDPATQKQYKFNDDLGGHFSGSLDLRIKGLPEAPKTWHVGDVKTAKDSKFQEFKKHGTKEVSPEYYGQAQSYMAKTGTDRAVYIYYNKDTSEIWIDRIKKEKFAFEKYLQKAERIVHADAPPESGYPSRNWFEIKRFKSDQYQAIYWGDELPLETNCRNCKHSIPLTERPGAKWACTRHEIELPHIEQQKKGCNYHQWLSELIPLEFVAAHTPDCTEYKTKSGTKIFNVAEALKEQHPGELELYTSTEIAGLSRIGFNDEFINGELADDLRKKFGAKLEKAERLK